MNVVLISMLAAAVILAFYVVVPVSAVVRGSRTRLTERKTGFTPVLAPGELADDGIVYRSISRTVTLMQAVCNVFVGYIAFYLLALAIHRALGDTSGIGGTIGSGAGRFADYASKLWIDVTIPVVGWSSKVHLFVLIGAFVIVLRAIGTRAKIRGILIAVIGGLTLVLLNFLLVKWAVYFGMPYSHFGG